jgi:hypothetical protein
MGAVNLYKATFRYFISALVISFLVVFISIGGALILLTPAIMFALSLMFAWRFVITENSKGLKGLAQSHRLVMGKWWSTLWKVLAIAVCLTVINSIPVMIVGSLTMVYLPVYSGLAQSIIFSIFYILLIWPLLMLSHTQIFNWLHIQPRKKPMMTEVKAMRTVRIFFWLGLMATILPVLGLFIYNLFKS